MNTISNAFLKTTILLNTVSIKKATGVTDTMTTLCMLFS